MIGYSFALSIHLLSLILAIAATALLVDTGWQLRLVESADVAAHGVARMGKIARAFPLAVIGLLGSGAYMVQQSWTWSASWIVAGLAGLGMIVLLGAGIEATRARALKRELEQMGFSERARRLLRDPIAWGARLTTVTLILALVFVMTTKPGAAACTAALLLAVAVGVLGALSLNRKVRASR